MVHTATTLLGDRPRSAGTRLRVHLTVDTECSHGGVFRTTSSRARPVGPDRRIWGRHRGREYGIRSMMDRLEAAGLAATFFLEPLAHHHFGEAPIAEVAKEIHSRGHGLELHVHPNFLAYRELRGEALTAATANPFPDRMWAYSRAEQAGMIEAGAERIEHWSGRRPVAFRAGGYAADAETHAALRELGFAIDSSAIHPAAGRLCRLWPEDPPNAPRVENGLAVLPVTTFVSRGIAGRRVRRILEVSAATLGQMRSVLESLDRDGVTDAVLMLHSFSFLRAYDDGYRRVRPDRAVIRRFEALLEYLAARRDRFEVTTMGELADRLAAGEVEIGGPDTDPDPGRRAGIARDLVQILNRR